MWNSIYYFVMVPMVYMAFAVLFLGILFKFIIVAFSPKIKGTLGIYPRKLPRLIGVLKDSFLVPVAYHKSKFFWFMIIAFHAAFLLLIIGHFELIREFKILQIIPHNVFLGKGFVGIVLIIATIYFLLRRFRSPYNAISVPEDYILLLLLFLTMIFGSHMNLAATYGVAGFDIPVNEYRAYLSSIIAFNPIIPDAIKNSPHYVLVVLHIFFANLFIMVFPFSKMIHSLFIFIAHTIKRK